MDMTESLELPASTSAQLPRGILVTPAWYGLKQQIHHQAQFGGSVQVVCGVKGAGKSTLLKILLAENDPPIVGLDAAAFANLAELLAALLRELGLISDSEPSAGESIAHLRGYVQQLEKTGARTVVALDNADILDDAALAALVSVLQGHQDVGFGLHWLFLAKPGLAERIDQLQLLDIAVSDVVIPNFSPSELKTLLLDAHKAKRVKSAVPVEQMQRIWAESGGFPGPAMALLSNNQPQSVSQGMGKSAWPISHIVALTLLLVVLAWAVLVRDSGTPTSNNASADGELKSRTSAEIAIGSSATGEQSAVIQDAAKDRPEPQAAVADSEPGADSSSSNTSAIDSAATQEVAETPDVELGLNLDEYQEGNDSLSLPETRIGVRTNERTQESADTDKPLISQVPVAAESPDDSEITENANLKEPQVEDSSQINTAVETIVPADNLASSQLGVSAEAGGANPLAKPDLIAASKSTFEKRVAADEAGLLALPSGGYVLQLMATSAADKLESFIKAQPNQSDLRIFRAVRNGKSLFILLEGYYQDSEAAQAGIARLPDKQRKGGPWPKKLEPIQREIRQMR